MRSLSLLILCLAQACFAEDLSWTQDPDPEAIEWMRQQISTNNKHKVDLSQFTQGKCLKNKNSQSDPDSKIVVFMSFSVPDSVWISLSKELEKLGGVFILRGLPENSFALLAKKIKKLSDLGVNTPIQIDPRSFLEFDVQTVPCFVFKDGSKNDKVTGNISLSYAKGLIQAQGDTK